MPLFGTEQNARSRIDLNWCPLPLILTSRYSTLVLKNMLSLLLCHLSLASEYKHFDESLVCI